MRSNDAFTLDDLPGPGDAPGDAKLTPRGNDRPAAGLSGPSAARVPLEENSARDDPHRPGVIIPTDYSYVLSFGLMPPPEPGEPPIRFNVSEALKFWETEKFCRIRGGIFSCTVCGAHYNHGDIWCHKPTGEHITVGHDCADKYSLFHTRQEWEAWHKEQTRLRSLAAKERKYKQAAHSFLERHPGLKEAFDLLEGDSYIKPETRPIVVLRDMLFRLNRYGSLSENTVAYALKLAEELRKPKEEEKHVPAPIGRVTVRGTVVSLKDYESNYGPCYKMTVKVETSEGSWLVFVSVPSCLTVERGMTVEFKATLEHGNEPHFAFGKRPTGARVIVE